MSHVDYLCKDPYCKGNVVVTYDHSVCSRCGLVSSTKNLDNITFNQMDNVNFSANNATELYNPNLFSSLPSDFKNDHMTHKEAVSFSRKFKQVEQINLHAHEKRAYIVIKKTSKHIDLLPTLFGLNETKKELTTKASIAITQIYHTWFAARNSEFLLENQSLINDTFSGKAFSLPKDSDIISAVAIRIAIQFLRVIKGGISNVDIYRAIKQHSKLTEKFKVRVSRFYNIIQINHVVDLNRFGGSRQLNNITQNHYINETVMYCNRNKFPVKVTTRIQHLMEECIHKVWLGGKNPKNVGGATVYHVIWVCTEKLSKKDFEELSSVRVRFPKKKLLKSIDLNLDVRGKMAIQCSHKIKKEHDENR